MLLWFPAPQRMTTVSKNVAKRAARVEHFAESG
jgi:hypothetical protein